MSVGTNGCEGEMTSEVRLDVSDALYELVARGELPEDILDEVGPRLLPEVYPDIQEWYAADMPVDAAITCTNALRNLAATDRLSHRHASQARAYLGILGVEVAA